MAYNNLLIMCKKRGYRRQHSGSCPTTAQVFTNEEWHRVSALGMVRNDDDPILDRLDRPVIFLFFPKTLTQVEDVRSLLSNIGVSGLNRQAPISDMINHVLREVHPIILYYHPDQKLDTPASQEQNLRFKDGRPWLEIHAMSRFLVDISHHRYQPEFRIWRYDEQDTDPDTKEIYKDLDRFYGRSKLAVTLLSDPMSRYYEASRRDIFEVRRPDGDIAYRIVGEGGVIDDLHDLHDPST
jgi:hypothetical protein